MAIDLRTEKKEILKASIFKWLLLPGTCCHSILEYCPNISKKLKYDESKVSGTVICIRHPFPKRLLFLKKHFSSFFFSSSQRNNSSRCICFYQSSLKRMFMFRRRLRFYKFLRLRNIKVLYFDQAFCSS